MYMCITYANSMSPSFLGLYFQGSSVLGKAFRLVNIHAANNCLINCGNKICIVDLCISNKRNTPEDREKFPTSPGINVANIPTIAKPSVI